MGQSKARPGILSWGRIAVFGGAAFLLGTGVAEWLGHHRVDAVPAVLQARTLGVTAGRPCRIEEVFVRAGESVAAGQPLVRLTDDRLTALINAKTAELQELTAEWQRAQATAEIELAWRNRELEQERLTLQQDLARLMQDRVDRQVEQIAWQERLQGMTSTDLLASADSRLRPVTLTRPQPDTVFLQAVLKEDAAASALETLEVRVRLCEERLQALAGLSQALTQKVRISAGVDVAHTRVQHAQEALENYREQEAALTIHSSGYGIVGNRIRQPGELVEAGDVVLELLDDAQLSLSLQLPSGSAGQMTNGSEVVVLFPGEASRQGVVAAIAPQATGASAEEDSRLPVSIRPTGKLWPKVPIGSRVMVMLPNS